MKSRPLLITLSVVLLLGLACWPAFSSRAAAGHTGAGQQVGEPFRVPAIAAGDFHSLALKSDGTVVAWGNNVSGQTTIPGGLSNVTAIAAGDFHSLALKSDGTVV
ncbi:MAG TPA: RCC1 domain-containing protein, partial [Blastocatellia bacterium]|nr:RCC1 domain-containing protein [Blastocatellia bacterium]HMZ20884.1 RCC1 domain-containing protein [Blastocatellia bacterium]